jgi:hypothetical protein
LNVAQYATGLGDQRIIIWIHGTDAMHARERDDDLRSVCARRRSAAITRVAPDRHDADVRFAARTQDRRHLFGAVRPQNERRGTSIQLAMVDRIRRDIGRLIEITGRPSNAPQFVEYASGDAHSRIMAKASRRDE